jgi:hypothetical protein
MKKLLLIALSIILAFQIQAQYKPVILGLKIGTTMGWMKPDTEGYTSEGVKLGFTWGFIGEFYFMENYALSTGFNMGFNGGKLDYPVKDDLGLDGVMHRTYNLRYIQIPLALKMKTELNEKLNIFGKIGLGTGFCINAKANDEIDYTDGTSDSKDKRDINEDIALMRESLIVGGGVELKIKESTAIIVELMYDNAFNDILMDDNPAVAGEPKALLNYVELGVGIVF